MKHKALAKVLIGLVLVAGFGIVALRIWGAPTPATDERGYAVTGVLLALEADDVILVAHRAIPGFMPAMTMPFTLANPRDRERLSRGDVVQFTFLVGSEGSRATDLTVVGRDEATAAAYAATSAENSARLRPGDRMPAFSLVDQDGAPVSDADLVGRRTVVTFIFTRCPVPEYCPRIVGRFREIQRELAKDFSLADVRLLSVTLDPEYDTPQVLNAYGRALRADFDRWRFATGSPDQVSTLTRAFSVHVEKSGGLIDHTLATALINADGRVVEIWRGNVWETQEVLDAVTRLRRAN